MDSTVNNCYLFFAMRLCHAGWMAKTGLCPCGKLFIERGYGVSLCSECIVAVGRARRESGDSRRARRTKSGPGPAPKMPSAALATCRCGGVVTILRDRGSREPRCASCVKDDNRERRAIRARVRRVWGGIISRCKNKHDQGWANYGGRGIKVCKRWMNFENFFKDMGPMGNGMSIERIDVNGDYCPENCVWLERKLQNRNQRRNKLTTEKARELFSRMHAGESASALAIEFNISDTHARKIKKGRYWKGVECT